MVANKDNFMELQRKEYVRYEDLPLETARGETLEIPAAKAALRDAESRVQCMMLLYNKLYQSAGLKSVSVLEYLPALISDILANFPNSASIRVEKIIDDFRAENNRP